MNKSFLNLVLTKAGEKRPDKRLSGLVFSRWGKFQITKL